MAVVVVRPGASATVEEIVEHCRTQIASYKKPRHVVFADEIVKLPSGKIDKLTNPPLNSYVKVVEGSGIKK
jgi:acyl-CoA synthetase (AMP-forming)/AMP-acid ligase II